MQDIATKVEGSQLTAEEFNQIPSELENTITSTGQTLSSSDVRQLVKAVAIYAAKGDFYTTSGTANAIVLNSIDNMQSPISYSVGMKVRFMPTLNNTDIVTIAVNNLQAVSLFNNEGSNLIANELVANQFYTATFDGNNFKISETPMAWVRQIVDTKVDKSNLQTIDSWPIDNPDPDTYYFVKA